MPLACIIRVDLLFYWQLKGLKTLLCKNKNKRTDLRMTLYAKLILKLHTVSHPAVNSQSWICAHFVHLMQWQHNFCCDEDMNTCNRAQTQIHRERRREGRTTSRAIISRRLMSNVWLFLWSCLKRLPLTTQTESM